MRRWSWRIGAGAVALLVAGCGGDEEATPLEAACGGLTELVVTSQKLTAEADGASSIVLTHAGAENVDAITDPGVVASRPTFSPTAEQIAFVRADRGYLGDGPLAESLWTIGVDGTGLTQLTGGEAWDQIPDGAFGVHDTDPAWSPVDDRIAFSRTQLSPDPGGDEDHPIIATQQLFVVEPGGDSQPLVANEPGQRDLAPAWSADGSQLAFLRIEDAFGRNPTTAVWVAAADGAEPRRVAEVPAAVTVAWNPDGNALLVAGRPVANDPGLRRVDLGSGEVAVLSSGFWPAWAADGRHLYLFTRVPDSITDLRITTVTSDGDQLTDVRQAQRGLFRDAGPGSGLDVVRCLVED